MPEPKVKFAKYGDGSYGVVLAGTLLGRVRKWSEHYNLRRSLTIHGWLAYDTNGDKVARPGTRSGAWNTRTDAAEALRKAATDAN